MNLANLSTWDSPDVVGTDEPTQRVSSISRCLNSLSLLKGFYSDRPGCCFPLVNISKWVFALCFGETGVPRVPRNVHFLWMRLMRLAKYSNLLDDDPCSRDYDYL